MVTYVKISDLPVATEATGDSELEVNQAGVTRRITVDQIADVIAEILPPPDMSDYATDEEVADAIAAIPPADWNAIANKPTTFPPTVPIAWADISGEPSTYPPSAHSHLAADLPAPPTTLPPNGAAGGDLSGSYPNPLIKPSVTNGQVLTTVAGVAAWAAAAGGGASISIDVTPPGSPTAGALWWNSDAATGGGQLMIYYNDGSTTQWVPASPGMSTPTTPGGDFYALRQNLTINPTATVVTGWTTVFANAGNWLNATNGRFMPPAGRFFLFAGYSFMSSSSQLVGGVVIYKNGVAISSLMQATSQAANNYGECSVQGTFDANGTDYFEMYCTGHVTATANTFFFGAYPISGIKGPPGDPGVGLLQTVSYQTGAVATGTTVIPFDDTIPQIGEGNEYMTLSITPRSATSRLVIEAVVNVSHSVAGAAMCAALFQDATANALATGYGSMYSGNALQQISIRHTMTSGTTSTTTFRVRAGGHTAGTMTLNGQSSARIYGGVMASSIVIQEVL